MASTDLELVIKARDEASRALGGIKGALGGLGSAITAPARGMGNLISTVGRGMATFGLAVNGLRELGHAVSGLTEAAIGEQNAQSQLDAVLKSTGGTAGMTKDELLKLANSLQDTTRFGDETVQSAESLLLTFTSIGKDVFPQATKTVLDMSQALGQDTKSSAIQLGKALNDPIQGVTALRRVGVSFNEAQLTQIKTMQESGDLMGAQKIIMAELSKEFGGAAVAAGKTFAGQMDIARNRIGDAQKAIGFALIPILGSLAANVVPVVVRAIQLFAGALTNDVIPAVTWLAGWLSGPFNTAWVLVRDAILTFKQAISGDWSDDSRVRPLHRAIGNLGILINHIATNVLPPVVKGFGFLRDHFSQIVRVGRDLFTVLNPIGSLLSRFVLNLSQGQGAGEAFRNALSGVVGAFKELGGLILTGLKAVDWPAVGKAVLGGISGALSGLKDLAAGVDWAGIASSIGDAIAGVDWSKPAGKVKDALSGALGKLTDWGGDLVTWFVNTIKGVDWGPYVTEAKNGIVAAFSTVLDWGADIVKWFADSITGTNWGAVVTAAKDGIVAGFGTVLDWGSSIVGWFSSSITGTDWGGFVTSVKDGIVVGFGTVLDWGASVVGWFQSVITGTDWSAVDTSIRDGLVIGFNTVVGWGQSIADWINANLVQGVDWSGAAQSIATGLSDAVGKLQTTGNGNSGGILAMVGLSADDLAAFAPVGAAFNQFLADAATGAKGFTDAFKGLDMPALQEALGNIGTVVGATLVVAFRALGEVLKVVLPILGTAIVGGLNILADMINVTAATVSLLVDEFTIAGEAIGVLSDFISNLGDDFKGMSGTVQAAFQTAADWLVGAGGDIISGLVDGISGAWDSVTTELGNAASTVEGAITDAASWLTSTGTDIISGVVTGITNAWSTLTGKVGEIKGGVTGAITDALTWLVGIGTQVIAGLIVGINAVWSTIANKAGEIEGAITGAVSGAITWLYQKGWDAIQGLVDGITAAISVLDPVGIVTGIGGKIAGALNPFSRSPWPRMIKYGFDAIHGLAIGITDADAQFDPAGQTAAIGAEMLALLTTAIKSGQTDAAKAAADTVKSVVDAFRALLDLGTQLKTATFPGIEQISQLKFLTEHAVRSIADSAALFKGPALDAAKQFADTGKAIFDLFGSVFAAFSGDKLVIPANSSISQLKFAVELAVRSIADSAAMFTGDALTNAKAFADAAGSVIGMLKGAVEAFAALKDFDPSKNLDQTIIGIATFAGDVIDRLEEYSEQFTTGVYAAATTYAAAIKDSVGWITDAVNAFNVLKTFDPSQNLDAVIIGLVVFAGDVIDRLETYSEQWLDGVYKAATDYAAAIKDSIGWITDAVNAFTALRDFDPSKNLDQTIIGLVTFAGDVIDRLEEYSEQWLTGVYKAATDYASAIKDSVGWITDAVKAFDELKTFDPSANLDAVIIGLVVFAGDVIDRLEMYSEQWQTGVYKAATDYAGAIKDSIGWITDGVKAFEALATLNYKPIVDKAVVTLVEFASYVIGQLGKARGSWTDAALKAATDYADAVKTALGWIGDAIKSFEALADFKPTKITKQLQFVVDTSAQAVTLMESARASFTVSGLKSATDFASAVGSIVETIGKSVDAFSHLSEARFTTNVMSNLTVFGTIVTQAVGMLAQYDNELDPGVTAADSIAAKINKIIATLASAGNALASGGVPSGTLTVSGGVPSSAGGGLGSGNTSIPAYAPQAASGATGGGSPITLSEGSIAALAAAIQMGAQVGSQAGVAAGIGSAM